MTTSSVASLKAHLSSYLRLVERGEEVVVTSHDHPVARIVPVGPAAEGWNVRRAAAPVSALRKVRGVSLRKPFDPLADLAADRAAR